MSRLRQSVPSVNWMLALAVCLPACTKAADQPVPPATGQDAAYSVLALALQAHRWTLQSATDGQGHPIDALTVSTASAPVFSFDSVRISIQGACNRLSGGYHIGADGQLVVGLLAATMMACEAPLMQADAALSALLAKPLEAELTPGATPGLRLVSADQETLRLTGEATLESLYGAPTRIFLEVAAERVACTPAQMPPTTCLRVRERRFDEQGLSDGKPGEWMTFSDPIEGYTHQVGVRNVLRINRFQRAQVPTDASAFVYVLDLVVESETVSK